MRRKEPPGLLTGPRTALRPRRPSRRPAAAAAALLVAALCAGPAMGFGKNKIPYQRFDWQVYRSIHFEIYYYPEEAEFLDQMISFAESAYEKVSKALDHQPVRQDSNAPKIPVIFYKTHGEFEQTNILLQEIPEAVGAFSEPFQGRIVIPIDQPPDKVFQVLTHELVHIFQYSIFYGDSLRRVVRSAPPGWIMEGLASYIAEDEDNIDRMVIRDAVVNNILPTLEQLNVPMYLTYRYGHAIFEFITKEWGPSGIRNFLWEYRKVLLTNSVEKAVKEAFGIEVPEFDRRFNRYLRQKYFPVLMEKSEPGDTGHEIGLKEPERFTFSPTLSPSGELVATLATPKEELDVVIVSATDGKPVRNLTRGFTNRYEAVVTEAFSGRRDLSWSPDGDLVAFFVRRENRRDLLIYNALKGGRVARYEPPVDIPASPAFSPDGKVIAFSGNQAGIFDIFTLDLAGGSLTNLTEDNYYDGNPSWSPDGTSILYNRRIGAYPKIFLMEAANPQRKTQMTFGPWADLMPVYGRDGKTILFVSDRGSLGIFNLWSLDTQTGELKRWTDLVGGAFAPAQLSSPEGQTAVAYVGYFRGTFRLYRTDLKTPLETIPAGEMAAALDATPFKPPLALTSDAAEKHPYDKLRWNVDAPSIAVGVADDGTIFTDTTIIFSDLLGDHRVGVQATSVSTYANMEVMYLNLKRRLQWGAQVLDYRDYYVAQTTSGDERINQSSRTTAALAAAQYPLNRYYRFEGEAGYLERRLDYPVLDVQGNLSFESFSDGFVIARVGFSGDTTRFKEFGPLHGKRFQLNVLRGANVSGDTGSFTNYSLDFRGYGKVTSRSLLAWRLASVFSTGPGRGILSMGGFNQLRGYDFRNFIGNRIAFTNLEFRFPLIDDLRFPFGSMGRLRGTVFLDAGAAWFEDDLWYDPKLGNYRYRETLDPDTLLKGFEFETFSPFDSDNNRLQDLRASWGLGFSFDLFGMEWHWDFAHLFPYTEFHQTKLRDPDTGQPVLDAFGTPVWTLEKAEVNDGTVRTNFWIGFSF